MAMSSDLMISYEQVPFTLLPTCHTINTSCINRYVQKSKEHIIISNSINKQLSAALIAKYISRNVCLQVEIIK